MHQVLNGGCSGAKKSSRWQKMLGLFLVGVVIVSFAWKVLPKNHLEKGFILAEVQELLEVTERSGSLFQDEVQNLKIWLPSDEVVEAEFVKTAENNHSLKVGQKVVVNQVNESYQVVDVYRLPVLWWLFAGLFLLAILLAGWSAVYAFLGLAFSVWVLIYVVVGGVLNGGDPVVVSIWGGLLISVVSVYLGHGFNKKTSLAILSIILTLIGVGLLSKFVLNAGLFLGLGSEEAFFLFLDSGFEINLKGILLAGILIGTLGVLDDITTTQVAVVNELLQVNGSLSWIEVYKKAINVGKEHIVALINTLVLAYAGAAMPLFILFLQGSIQPVWVLLNGEFLAEEIVRTLLGSIALVASVPISTFLGAYFLKKR